MDFQNSETGAGVMASAPGGPVDFGSFLAVDSISYKVLGLDGQTETGWVIEIAGPSHPKTIAWNDQQSAKNLRRNRQIEQAQINNRKFTPEEKTPDQLRRENAEWIANRILGWSPISLGFLFGNNDAVPFTVENAIRIFTDTRMNFVQNQLFEIVTEEKRFMQSSAKN